MKKLLIIMSLFFLFKTTSFSQQDSARIHFYSAYDSSPLMWNRIVILEKDKYSLDTFADREGLYVHYYESINLHNTSFIFGLGWGVYAVHKRLIDLLVDSVVYQKGGNSFFDTITMQRVDTSMCKSNDEFYEFIEKWNQSIRKDK